MPLAAPDSPFAPIWSSSSATELSLAARAGEEAEGTAANSFLQFSALAGDANLRDELEHKLDLAELSELQQSLQQLLRDGTPPTKTARFEEQSLVL